MILFLLLIMPSDIYSRILNIKNNKTWLQCCLSSPYTPVYAPVKKLFKIIEEKVCSSKGFIIAELFGHQRKALLTPAVFFIYFIYSLNQV